MSSVDPSENPPGGEVYITDRAVHKVVTAATASVPGTVSAGGGFDKLTGMSFPRFDLLVDRASHIVTVEATIAVSWPSPVTDVAEKVRTTIARWITDATGMNVGHVNVVVGNVVGAPDPVTALQVAAADEQPTLAPVAVAPSEVTSPRYRRRSAALATTREVPVRTRPARQLDQVHTAAEIPLAAVQVAPERPLEQVHTAVERPMDAVEVRPSPEPAVPREPEELRTVPVHVAEERPLTPVDVAEELPLREPRVVGSTPVVTPAAPLPRRLTPVRVVSGPEPVHAVLPVRAEPFVPKLPPKRPLTPVRIVPRGRFSPAQQKGGPYGPRVD